MAKTQNSLFDALAFTVDESRYQAYWYGQKPPRRPRAFAWTLLATIALLVIASVAEGNGTWRSVVAHLVAAPRVR
jgi:hypothetical protein